jgi:hypothetical protein
MDRRIRFETKEESNARREGAFTDLSPAERLLWFLRSFNGRRTDAPSEEKPGNFVIRKRADAVR